MIEVIAAIIKDKDKILIARRWEWKHLAGLWEFPWWKLEEWEDHKVCLKREIREELWLDIEVWDFFMNNKHVYGTKEISLSSYFCTIISWEITAVDHDQILWVKPSELPEFDFAPADIPFIVKLFQNA